MKRNLTENFKAPTKSKSLNDGKWTPEEHKKFLQGIERFGNRWQKVMECVKTRNCAQIRSHCQKYFRRQRNLKLQELKKSGRLKNSVFLVLKEYYHHSLPGAQEASIEEKKEKVNSNSPLDCLVDSFSNEGNGFDVPELQEISDDMSFEVENDCNSQCVSERYDTDGCFNLDLECYAGNLYYDN